MFIGCLLSLLQLCHAVSPHAASVVTWCCVHGSSFTIYIYMLLYVALWPRRHDMHHCKYLYGKPDNNNQPEFCATLSVSLNCNQFRRLMTARDGYSDTLPLDQSAVTRAHHTLTASCISEDRGFRQQLPGQPNSLTAWSISISCGIWLQCNAGIELHASAVFNHTHICTSYRLREKPRKNPEKITLNKRLGLTDRSHSSSRQCVSSLKL